MSLGKAVKMLSEALSLLDQWGKIKVGEVGIVNKAYRKVYEAYYLLRDLEKKLSIEKEEEGKGFLERLWNAVKKLKWALEELGKGRKNPATVYVVGARADIDSVLRKLVLTQLRSLGRRLDVVEKLVEELRHA